MYMDSHNYRLTCSFGKHTAISSKMHRKIHKLSNAIAELTEKQQWQKKKHCIYWYINAWKCNLIQPNTTNYNKKEVNSSLSIQFRQNLYSDFRHQQITCVHNAWIQAWPTLKVILSRYHSPILFPLSFIPPPRDTSVLSRLRTATQFPRPVSRTKKYCSFINNALNHYQVPSCNR